MSSVKREQLIAWRKRGLVPASVAARIIGVTRHTVKKIPELKPVHESGYYLFDLAEVEAVSQLRSQMYARRPVIHLRGTDIELLRRTCQWVLRTASDIVPADVKRFVNRFADDGNP